MKFILVATLIALSSTSFAASFAAISGRFYNEAVMGRGPTKPCDPFIKVDLKAAGADQVTGTLTVVMPNNISSGVCNSYSDFIVFSVKPSAASITDSCGRVSYPVDFTTVGENGTTDLVKGEIDDRRLSSCEHVKTADVLIHLNDKDGKVETIYSEN